MPPANERLKQAILAVIANQIASNDPPETKQTLARLVATGYSDAKARQLIGFVVGSEIFSLLQEGRKYDGARYVAALQALPKLPWPEGEAEEEGAEPPPSGNH